jgi:hypothetical protein
MIIDLQGGDKLSFFQDLYTNAKGKLEENFSKLNQHLAQYKGSTEIDGENAVDAKLVRNITYELIESQVTGYIPSAKVDPRMHSEKNDRNALAIERLCSAICDEVGIEAINDLDERYTYTYGGSIFLVEWDESITTHNTVGDVKITNISPHNFIPQPNIFRVEDMEYCFVDFETTKESIMRKYDKSLEVAEQASNEEGEDEDTATLHICYYRDENGKVCEYVFCGDTELLDIDDFYARKRKICTKCGKKEGLCTCEKPKFKLVSEEYEELDHDIEYEGEVIIPMMSEVIKDGQVVTEEVTVPAMQQNGMPVFDVDANGNIMPMMTTQAKPKMEATRLPFYRPDRLPIVIRKNTSQENSLLGQSDCEFIRPQQQAINKVESRILEKVIKAGVAPILPEDSSIVLSDAIFDRVIKVKPGQAADIGRLDMQVNISNDLAEAERLYDHAKRILGISDSFQGQHDSSAQSGKAKQLQINQASGRLDSKRRMKNFAYSELYEIIFKYYLAYADEPRPLSYKDRFGKVQNVMFNRYAFVERDEAGEYYYNDSYLFSADPSADVEQDRMFLWEQNRLNLSSGAYGDPNSPQTRLTYWRNMEKAHYPYAHDIVEDLKAEIEQAEQMQALQQQNAQLSTEIEQRKGYEDYLRGEIMKNVNVQ